MSNRPCALRAVARIPLPSLFETRLLLISRVRCGVSVLAKVLSVPKLSPGDEEIDAEPSTTLLLTFACVFEKPVAPTRIALPEKNFIGVPTVPLLRISILQVAYPFV